MKRHNIFNIPFKNAKLGLHDYHFQVDSTFFSDFENSTIEKGTFDIAVTLDKRENMLNLEFNIDGNMEGPCDRCLANILIPVHENHSIIVKFDDMGKEDTDEVIYIGTEETNLDLRDLIYEFISISKPMSNIIDCDDNDNKYCDMKVLEYYRELEEESEEDELDNDNDRIWEALKDIKLN